MMTPAQRDLAAELWPQVLPLAGGDPEAEGVVAETLCRSPEHLDRPLTWWRQRVRWAVREYRRRLAVRRSKEQIYRGDLDALPSVSRGTPTKLPRKSNDRKRSQ